jgi:hypothetical protein
MPRGAKPLEPTPIPDALATRITTELSRLHGPDTKLGFATLIELDGDADPEALVCAMGSISSNCHVLSPSQEGATRYHDSFPAVDEHSQPITPVLYTKDGANRALWAGKTLNRGRVTPHGLHVLWFDGEHPITTQVR